VICHGLVSASHLNGQLGDVRGGRYNDNRMLRLKTYELHSNYRVFDDYRL